MTNTLTNLEHHTISNAMCAALDKFYLQHPEVEGIALDTIRKFASERFEKACTPESVNDARFAVEAPVYAYRLLVEETLTLAKALK